MGLDTCPAGQLGACWLQRPRDQFRGAEGIWGHFMWLMVVGWAQESRVRGKPSHCRPQAHSPSLQGAHRPVSFGYLAWGCGVLLWRGELPVSQAGPAALGSKGEGICSGQELAPWAQRLVQPGLDPTRMAMLGGGWRSSPFHSLTQQPSRTPGPGHWP